MTHVKNPLVQGSNDDTLFCLYYVLYVVSTDSPQLNIERDTKKLRVYLHGLQGLHFNFFDPEKNTIFCFDIF